jgi:acetyl-CoA synthetase
MTWKTIEKQKSGWSVVPNLLDYDQTHAEFSWDAARKELDGLPCGHGLNIAYEAFEIADG